MNLKALVLRTSGTNCDSETVHALSLCGAKVDLLHLRELLAEPQKLNSYSIMVIPGGFSYGDDIAAGRILANEMKYRLETELRKFVLERKLLIGICNGFQVLVKTGLLPGNEKIDFNQTVTLTYNDSGRFQCEWVKMKMESSKAKWLKSFPSLFEFPIAHGEGKFVASNSKALAEIEKNGQVVFRYSHGNPNGSQNGIAGICNSWGNVIGMMPHPERFVTKYQHPSWSRNETKEPTPGFLFWKYAVDYARKLK